MVDKSGFWLTDYRQEEEQHNEKIKWHTGGMGRSRKEAPDVGDVVWFWNLIQFKPDFWILSSFVLFHFIHDSIPYFPSKKPPKTGQARQVFFASFPWKIHGPSNSWFLYGSLNLQILCFLNNQHSGTNPFSWEFRSILQHHSKLEYKETRV